jgi:hypothetical protein
MWTREQKQRKRERKGQKVKEKEKNPGKEAKKFHPERPACPRKEDIEAPEASFKPSSSRARWQSRMSRHTV